MTNFRVAFCREKKTLEMDYPSRSIWFSKRFFVSVVMFLCFTNSTLLTNNMNIAVVEMTTNKTINVGNITLIQPAEFQWDTITIGTVSSILSYGGLLSFLHGYFADLLGGSVSCAMSMMITGILTILHPFALYLDFNWFLVCRFFTGFFLNLFFISTSETYSRWFPIRERSFLISIGYNGFNAGATIAYPVFGFIAEEWGWQMIFYASGIISLFSAILCLIMIKNRPTQDSRISKEELAYILEETEDASRRKKPHPYKSILLSGPVLALCIGKFTMIWLDTVLTASLPLYVEDLTGKSTSQVGLISSIPTAVQILTFPIAGALLDAWKNNTKIEMTRMHKIIVGFAYFTSSILFLPAILVNDFTTSIILFVSIQAITSVIPAVFEPIIVSISPDDSSVIAGLTRFFTCVGVIIPRILIGIMTTNHSYQEWNNCFLLTAGVLAAGAAIFMKFASSEAQPWSSLSTYEQERSPLKIIKYRRRSST